MPSRLIALAATQHLTRRFVPGYTGPDDFNEDEIRAAVLAQDTPPPCPSAKHLPVTVRAVLILMLQVDVRKRISSKEVDTCHTTHLTLHTSYLTLHTSKANFNS